MKTEKRQCQTCRHDKGRVGKRQQEEGRRTENKRRWLMNTGGQEQEIERKKGLEGGKEGAQERQ